MFGQISITVCIITSQIFSHITFLYITAFNFKFPHFSAASRIIWSHYLATPEQGLQVDCSVVEQDLQRRILRGSSGNTNILQTGLQYQQAGYSAAKELCHSQQYDNYSVEGEVDNSVVGQTIKQQGWLHKQTILQYDNLCRQTIQQ